MNDKKPFNDVTDHYSKHVGAPANVEMKKLPKPLRWFGYFAFGFMSIALLIIVVAYIWQLLN